MTEHTSSPRLVTDTVAGIPFFRINLPDAVHWFVQNVTEKQHPQAVRLANSYCLALTRSNKKYRELLRTRGVNFSDGTPIAFILAAKADGTVTANESTVRGPSFFKAVLEVGQPNDLRHYLLGSTPETLNQLEGNIRSQYPNAHIVGAYSPPFESLSENYLNKITDEVSSSDANIVWVGMGTPKQDFVAQHVSDVTKKWTVGVGAAFDFVAHPEIEAPAYIQNSGLEWLFRFSKEPRRLWRRYTVGNLQFVACVFPDLLRAGLKKIRK